MKMCKNDLGIILLTVCYLLAMIFLVGYIIYVARLRTDYCDKGNHDYHCKVCGEELHIDEK